MNRRIYLAGAIGNGHTAKPRDMYKNVRYAETYYKSLIESGWTPFCPHLSYYPWLNFENDIHWETWLAMDLDYIDSCAALVRLPNKSLGADLEVKYADEIDIPVLYPKDTQDAVRLLEKEFGKPEVRPELQKYVSLIKNFKSDKNASKVTV